MDKRTVRVVMIKGTEVLEFNIHAEELRIVEQLIDRLKVYSVDEITVRYF